jgi:hypothetical protein
MRRDPDDSDLGHSERENLQHDDPALPESGMGGASDMGAGGGHPASRSDALLEGRSPFPLEAPGDADIERRHHHDPNYKGPERRVAHR